MEKKNASGRRKFMASLGLIGASAGLNPLRSLAGTASVEKLFRPPSGGLMRCKPYLQSAGNDSMSVRWITQIPCHGWVEYGGKAAQLDRKAQQTEEGMIQADNRVHAVTLSGLQPGSTYYYRVASRKTVSLERKKQSFGETVYSEVYSFTLPDENQESAEFLMFNDIHDRPESFGTLMQYAGESKPDFVFLNGDMFNRSEGEDQIIRHLIDPLTALFATRTPFYFGRGNHETWGAFARNLSEYIDGRIHKYYYSFSYGPLYGLVLDSGETKPDEDPANGGITDFDAYRQAQAKWLEEELRKPAFRKARFKVAFVHIPPYYASKTLHAAEQYKKIWMPLLNRAGIDLMLCGHTHRHGVHPPVRGQHEFPIVIGGGPVDGKRTLTHVKVTRHSLSLRIIDDSGETVGTLEL